MPQRLMLAAVIIAALSAVDGCDSTKPSPSLVGTWDLVSVTDSGTVGAGSGTIAFDLGGTFAVVGTVTYPGEPTDSLVVSGTWSQSGNTLTWTIGARVSTFQLAFSGAEVTITTGFTVTRLRRHT